MRTKQQYICVKSLQLQPFNFQILLFYLLSDLLPPTALHPKIMLKIEGTVVMLEESCSLPRFEIQQLLWIFHLISPVTKALSVYYR